MSETERYRWACLEFENGEYQLINFKASPSDDLHRAATLAGLKKVGDPFIVYAVIPDGVNAARFVRRRNEGIPTELCVGQDGAYYYVEHVLIDGYIRRWRRGEIAS